MATKYQQYINGEFVDAISGATREIRDPANGELVGIVPEGAKEDAQAAILAARKAFDEGPWRSVTNADRGKILLKIADLIRKHADELVDLEVRNQGKPKAEAEYDAGDAANCFEYYAGLATKLHGMTVPVPSNSLSMTVREPIGVVGQIIPWNYPMLMFAWKIAPALCAGCTIVIKPSEVTPITALFLARKIHEELPGLIPPGVLNIISGPGAGCGEELATSHLVDKIAFTGGTVTGRRIMQAATGNLKKCSLELGGKNPCIIFADADFEQAVDGALFAAFANQGEVCSAGSRILVERCIHKRFVEAMVAKIPKIKLGHGLTEGVKMGPLVSQVHRDKVMSYIEIGKAEGAKCVAGGRAPEHPDLAKGLFIEPTIFDDCNPAMRICKEEIFGPVMAVIPFDTEEEAIRIANDTEYGLAAGVFSLNIMRAVRVIRQIRAGITWINTYHPTYNELPWGGYKQSGNGRELGTYGIEEYLQVKQINIALDEAPLGWY